MRVVSAADGPLLTDLSLTVTPRTHLLATAAADDGNPAN